MEKLVVEDGNPVYHTNGNCLVETQSKTLIAGCKTSVIPNDGSVTVIGGFAFGECNQLPEITIPDAITRLDSAAFAYCAGLEKIVVPASISVIPDYCFAQCKELKQVELPDTITAIGHFAMYACLKLKSVRVPAGVKTIGEEVFCKATISGVAGSYAETYAKENNKKFVAE